MDKIVYVRCGDCMPWMEYHSRSKSPLSAFREETYEEINAYHTYLCYNASR